MASIKVITGDKKIDNKDTNKQQKIAIIGILIAIIIAVIITIVILNLNKNNNNDFDVANNIYNKHHISYTVDDYNNDKVAIDNGETQSVSESHKKMTSINNNFLNNYISSYTGQDEQAKPQPQDDPKPSPQYDESAWIEGLKNKLKTSKEWINNNYGTKESDFIMRFDEGKEYNYWKEHKNDISSIENYIKNGSENELQYYKTIKYSKLSSSLLYSSWNCRIFNTLSSSLNDGFNCYTNWYKNNNPVINNVYSVSLEECSKEYNSYTANIKGTITTDAGNFVVYSSITMDENNNISFEYYDVE